MGTWIRELTYGKLFSWVVLWPALWFGLVVYRATGRTPWFSYWAMRRLYCITRGRSNAWLSRRLGRAVPAVARPSQSEATAPETGVLASQSQKERTEALAQLERDGFVLLGHRLSEAEVSSLVQFASSVSARLMPTPQTGPTQACFDPAHPLSIKYDLPQSRLVTNPIIQRLLVDCSLREFACSYLGYEPINDLLAMWWSTAHTREANSEVAQLYHFDMDRPQFLKFFFYLTDVTTETGPHCYIRGSHRERASELWRDGRHSDAEVLAHYGSKREVEITAPRGTLIAVDTSGFHKGKALLRGRRLILQLEYTTALFGQSFERIKVADTDYWRRQIAAAPVLMSRFHVDAVYEEQRVGAA